MALLESFEGSTFHERVAQEAANMMKLAAYTGPRRNLIFGHYYNCHSMAHGKLLKENKPMTLEQKMDFFVQGIHYTTAQNIVVHVAGDPTIRTSFNT